ncbi:splicing regulator SDE2 [Alosa pseudoharengus]|uniref:splicing regulator SDE2 n=1 Tax=Alosa pseudoharengus TaxID=34774 RepID=UPI003F88AA86
MEVFVVSPSLQSRSLTFLPGSTVQNLIELFTLEDGIPTTDFYVKNNGRLSSGEEQLQTGAVYRLEPRLFGGKGGFGSMLRALGAQIEKTTNREACRDLSGRRLRDVNHEKEMAEWLKKQADREAEKEQRRLDRLQRKLAEPKHYFSDPDYERQCHDLSERLEDSVLRGMQAASSGLVQADEGPSRKRPAAATVTKATSAPKPGKKKCLWTGMGDLAGSDVDSDSASDDGDDGASPCASSSASCSSGGYTAPKSAAAAAVAHITPHTSQESPSSSSSSSSGANSPQRSPAQEPHPEQSQGEAPLDSQEEAQEGTRASGEAQAAGPAQASVAEVGAETEKPEEKMDTESQEAASSSTKSAEPEVPAGPLDLSAVDSVEQLEAMGLDRLKGALMERGMKCGGTLQERAARLFSVRGLAPNQIDPALLAKPAKGKKK